MDKREYIDREAARLAYEKSLANDNHRIEGASAIHRQEHRHILHILEKLPAADVVEVVRCCDCKYCETVIHSVVDEPKWFCTRMVRAFDVDPTSFCSYGERKEQT